MVLLTIAGAITALLFLGSIPVSLCVSWEEWWTYDGISGFNIVGKLGSGSFSEVLKVKERNSGNVYAAKKLFKIHKDPNDVCSNRELEALKKLDVHPNVMSLLDYFFDPQGSLIFLFNIMDCSLYDYIKDRNRKLPESQVKIFLYQLTCGLHHLHRNGLFHRDIKPENILIKTSPGLTVNPLKAKVLKLGDLGSVCLDRRLPHSAYVSTRWYRAPECLLTNGFYGPKMDIWALGCCFYEMLTLTPLFPGDNEIDQLEKIHDILGTPSETLLSKFKHRHVECSFTYKPPIRFYKFLPTLSQYGIDVITKMLMYHPDPRISVYKLIEHMYFEEFNKMSQKTRLRRVDRECHSEHSLRMTFTRVGPAFWGLINPEWHLCNKGRRQSPVNLEPQRLLFDPNLRPLHIDKHRISGTILNTGHSVIFTADNDTKTINLYGPQIPVNLTGGPLSYRYRFNEIHIHYGLHDQFGSEHSVEGYTFPAEIQIFGYNSQLYTNFTDALYKAQGIVGVAVLLQLGDLSNPELRMLTDQLERIRFGGDEAPIRRISVRGLLPDTEHYMTYEGSTTSPACHETVTWIVLNKPIYITKQQLFGLRRLMQGQPDHPKAPLGNNFRPPQPLLHRPVRTNIDFRNKQNGKACPTMHKEVLYKANSWKQH